MYSEILQMPGKFLDGNFGNNFLERDLKIFLKFCTYSEILGKLYFPLYKSFESPSSTLRGDRRMPSVTFLDKI